MPVCTSSSISPEKHLPSCAWPSIRNSERIHNLSQSWATWVGLDVTNFIRVSVCFFIVMLKVFAMFRHQKLRAFYTIDKVLPLDQ